MRAFVQIFVIGVGLAIFVTRSAAQDPPDSATMPQGDFFSGFVVSSSATELTVNRKGLGKETAATRKFTIDSSTKIEGDLKPKAHVTVRFVGDANNARAVHIIVR